jgi:ankyrin repeat protein
MEMARVLLKRGADPNAKNRFGAVPLMECVMQNYLDFINLLLEFGVI